MDAVAGGGKRKGGGGGGEGRKRKKLPMDLVASRAALQQCPTALTVSGRQAAHSLGGEGGGGMPKRERGEGEGKDVHTATPSAVNLLTISGLFGFQREGRREKRVREGGGGKKKENQDDDLAIAVLRLLVEPWFS